MATALVLFLLLLFNNPSWGFVGQLPDVQEGLPEEGLLGQLPDAQEEMPEEGLVEWVLDELLKPRLPPLTGLDIVLRKHDLIGNHLGELIYRLAKKEIKQMLANLNQENLNALADKTGIPGASWLTTVATLDDGWLLQYVLLVASRHWVLSRVGRALSRLTEWTIFKAGAFAIGKAADVLADPYRQLSREHLVRFLCSLIRGEAPASVFGEILKSVKAQVRSDAYYELFEAACNVRDPEKFTEYFDLLAKLEPSQLDRVPLRAFDGQPPERRRLWQVRRVQVILDTYPKLPIFQASLQKLQDELGGNRDFGALYLQPIDFFLGRSKLFTSALPPTKDCTATKAAQHLISFLNLASDWKALIRANALNLTWLLLHHRRQESEPLTETQCLQSAQYGTPAFLSVVLASGQCDKHVEKMRGRSGSPIFTDMMPSRRSRAAHQKILILSTHPEMRSVARRLRGYAPCQGLGSAVREIRTRLLYDPERSVLTDKLDMLEVTKAVVAIALGIPSCLLRGLDALPVMEKVTDWATAGLCQYCQAQKKWPALILQQAQAPPRPRWLRPAPNAA